MIRTEAKAKLRKSLGKKNFKVKVSALKIKHKKDMKEMTELAKVISGAKQDPPEPVDAEASDVMRLNAIIKKHRDSKWLKDVNFQQPTSRAIGELCMEPNEHLIERMMTSISISKDNVCLESSTELDSHANMVVIGKKAFIFNHSDQNANVRAFTDEVEGIHKL